MICEICGLKIVSKITLQNIFKIEKHHICEHCLQKYPIHVTHQVLPCEHGIIDWFSLIHEKEALNPIAYMSFLKPFYMHYINQHSHSIYLYFDGISDKLLNILQSLEFDNIYLVTLYDEIKEKEQTYVI
jgi:hypothetical protein